AGKESVTDDLEGMVDRRIAVELRMHRRQVIALAEILDDQLPVGVDLEAKTSAMSQQRQVAVGPALGEREHIFRQRRRLAVEIDEQQLVPGLAANRLQPQRNSIELVVRTAR